MKKNTINVIPGYPVSGSIGTGKPAAGFVGDVCATPRLRVSDHRPFMRSQASAAGVPAVPATLSAVEVNLRT